MLIAALTLLLVGAALLTRGLIGRRIGQELRCRNCNYNLTGVESKECPECGRPWTIESTPKGLRHRSKFAIALGCFLILAAGTLEAPQTRRWVGRQNFYDFVPARFALSAAVHGSPEALLSMMDRHRKHRLSRSQLELFAEGAIAAPINPTQMRGIDFVWGQAIWLLINDGAFSVEQYQRLFAVTVTVRPRVRAGDPIPFSITLLQARLSQLGLEAKIEQLSIESENHPVGATTTVGAPESLQRSAFPLWQGSALPNFNSGPHSLRFCFSYSVLMSETAPFRPQFNRPPGPVFATGIDVTRAVDVVSPELDSVEAIQNPHFADHLKNSLSADVTIVPSDTPNETSVTVKLLSSIPLPHDLAAELVLEGANGYQALPGIQVLHAHTIVNQGSRWPRTAGAFRPGDLVRVRLKSTRDLARMTTDVIKAVECDVLLGPTVIHGSNGYP